MAMQTYHNEWHKFQPYKATILLMWQRRMLEAFPGLYEPVQLQEAGALLFEQLSGPEDARTTKPWPFSLERMPMAHVVRGCSYWRQILADTLEQAESPERRGELRREIDRRVDALLERASMDYAAQHDRRLSEKRHALNKLNEERLHLIGKMAASLAHEIRNPLTAIKGFLKLIHQKISDEERARVGTYLQLIENEFDNIHMQITGFLSFSRKRISEEPRVPMTITSLLGSVISLLQPRFLSENVQLALVISEAAELSVQKVAVQQVLANIINNGLDALLAVEHDKKMTIRAFTAAGAYIIEITNNGPSIAPSIRHSLFEPFVTDKEDGTGLGLAICKIVMHKNDGRITYQTSAEQTSFALIFESKVTEHV